MSGSKTKSFEIHLSPYGYGMMALSTTIIVLLANGFFQKLGPDLFAVWFTVGLAAASGALSVALIKFNLPDLKKPLAVTYTTLVFIILFGSYLTSFFGYSEAYILYFLHPVTEHAFSFAKFMEGLEQVWLAVSVTAIACTVAYLIIYTMSERKKSKIVVQDIGNAETDGLAE
jgi:hypothetical protein